MLTQTAAALCFDGFLRFGRVRLSLCLALGKIGLGPSQRGLSPNQIGLGPRLRRLGLGKRPCLGTLLAYLTQGVLRGVELRTLFGWKWPWRALWRPTLAGAVALLPAVIVRVSLGGWASQLCAGLLFLGVYLLIWKGVGLEPSDRDVITELRAARRRCSQVPAGGGVSSNGDIERP